MPGIIRGVGPFVNGAKIGLWAERGKRGHLCHNAPMRPLPLPLTLLCLAALACGSLEPAATAIPTLPFPNVSVQTMTPPPAGSTALPPAGSTAPPPTPIAPAATAVILPTPDDAPLPAGAYRTQPGDTLTALIARFRVITDEVRSRYPNFSLTQTLPPGIVLEFSPLGYPPNGFATRLIPDNALVYAPIAREFNVQAFVLAQPGWLATYTETLKGETQPRPGWEIVQRYAQDYSVNPRLLLALLEYQSGALTRPALTDDFTRNFPLGAYSTQMEPGLSHQLGWAGGQLNYGYYAWRDGTLLKLALADGAARTPDPSLNAGTFALIRVLGLLQKTNTWNQALLPEGFRATYQRFFGDPWAEPPLAIPGNFTQPPMQLPFEPGKIWAFTSGPHPPFGRTYPFGALDFAATNTPGGCIPSPEWAVAVSAGVVIYSENGRVELDIGGGWEVVYLHIATQDRVAVGTQLPAGGRIGHPSCEGGNATGSHIHISRRYQGEWLPANGAVPFVLSGWEAQFGPRAYQGTLIQSSQVITACPCANAASRLQLGP